MKRTSTGLNTPWNSRALRVALMILPLCLSGCADEQKTDPPATTFDLAVNLSGSGSVTSSPAGIDCGSDCSERLTSESSITLSAAPASGFTFSGWSGDCSGSTTGCTLVMSANRAVTAIFTATSVPPPVQFTLAVNVTGNGSVRSTAGIACSNDCTEYYNDGMSVILTAAPSVDQQFSGWANACSGMQTTCTVSMTEARTVSASFSPVLRALTVTVNVNGPSVISTPAGINCGNDCTENYSQGRSVTLTAMAGTGFQFSSWSGACIGSGECVVVMSANRAVTATFAAVPDPSGSLTVGYNPATQSVTVATVVLDLAMPAAGNYPVWVSGVGVPNLLRAATHDVLPGGYFGRGFSRFSPGDFNDGGRGEHYCGIGQIHGFSEVGDSSRMVVGQLIRYGRSFFVDQAIKRPPDGSIKQLILIKDIGGSGSRPMLVTKGPNTSAATDTKVLAACHGTVCNTTNDINNVDYFNDGNHQPNLDNYLGEWLWVEFAVNTNIPFIRVRTWSADGVLSGAETIAPWGAGGHITDLDVISFVNGIVNPGPEPHYDLERVEFRVGSDANITPPAGFPGSAR